MNTNAGLRPDILREIVASKQVEVARAKERIPLDELRQWARRAAPPRDFCHALRQASPPALIAEIKKASPSQGVIRPAFHPVQIAHDYVRGGAHCLSVLTDEPYFQGHLQFLRLVRRAVSVPVLRKDFIIDEYQIVEARAAGADAVLLIAECLPAEDLRRLHQVVLDWQMTPLVEFYHRENLPAVLACRPRLVGVNNRDLNSFQVRLEHSLNLRAAVPQEILFVSESGIHGPADVSRLRAAGVDAMLVGESLMRQPDLSQAVRHLLRP